MTHTRLLLLIAATLMAAAPASAQIGIGQWRSHFSYHQIHQVQATGSHVYAAASQGLLRYDMATSQTTCMDKTTGLSDVGISTMAYDEASATLVIGYDNSNIDLMQEGEVINVSDLRRSAITGDKSIHAIRFHGGNAYLACAFGIVVLDLQRAEIKETYYIDITGRCNVTDIAFSDTLLYAATPTGLLHAPLTGSNLAIASSWTADSLSLIAGQPILRLAMAGTTLLALTQDSTSGEHTLFRQSHGDNFLPWQSGTIKNMRWHDSVLLLCTADSILLYNSTLQQTRSMGARDWMDLNVHDADWTDGILWMAHDWAGLVSYDFANTRLADLSPASPWNDEVYRLMPAQNKMILCHGGKTTTYNNVGISADIDLFADNTWSSVSGIADTLRDVIDVAVNPTNRSEWLACSWGHGIMQITNGRLSALYNETNTDGALTAYHNGTFRSLRTAAIAFDAGGNAWMTNSLATAGIVQRSKEGTWTGYDVSSMVGNSEIDKILFDSIRGYLWFAGRANRIYAFHLADDKVQLAYVNPNNGSKVETSSVSCMVQDHNGDLWIGTNKGVKKIYDGYKAFDNGGNGEQSPVTCGNILFSADGIVEYLMAYESVTCMAVDGANRKWIGTAEGGLYLLSATGMEQLEHFTAANSPLLSNKIITVAVNPQSGEVFIGTDAGLQSYRGTAVYATGKNSDSIYAFPNPVRPDYNGTIAIKGFSRNAVVHVTDAAGHGIFSTTAHGGQAVWNGRTNDGQRVASGVYFVFASDENSKMRAVTKILVVR